MATSETNDTLTGTPAASAEPGTETAPAAPMTSDQAAQVLAELKTIKQTLLWVLVIGGFFAARSFFFHY